MNKKDLKKFTEMLLEKAKELKKTYAQTKSSSLENSDDGSMDIADSASDSYNKEFLFSLSDEERKIIMLVDEALAKIGDNSYGKCSACGKDISLPRLNAVPWAKHCISCQELQEKGLL